jgi:hypothetical protein
VTTPTPQTPTPRDTTLTLEEQVRWTTACGLAKYEDFDSEGQQREAIDAALRAAERRGRRAGLLEAVEVVEASLGGTYKGSVAHRLRALASESPAAPDAEGT